MTRTQVQLPTHLYERAKRAAESREISLAELVRRGLETLLDQYPEASATMTPWTLPVANVGRVKVSLERLKDYSADDETFRSLVAEDADE